MAFSPLGISFFRDKGHQPELDSEKSLATVKFAFMIKDNIQVEKRLQPRPESEDLNYATEPQYESALSDETTAEKKCKEINAMYKKRTDWQNSCKYIEGKGPQVDDIPCDKIGNKARSLLNLSLGSQAIKIFHQRFPLTDVQKCTTDALVEQLKEAFIQTRNETFDRFQFFQRTQKEVESLEEFHSRIKKHAALCN